MAITFDTKARFPTTASSTSTATTLSTGYTTGSSCGALVVFAIWSGTTARTGGDPTYAGSPLTQAQGQAGVTETSLEAWYMLNPPSGSFTLSVPNSGGRTMWLDIASGNSTSASIGYGLDSSGTNSITAANPGVSVVTVSASTIVFVGVGTGDNSWLPTARTGTAIYDDDIGTWGGGSQYLIKSTSGSQTIGWTDATSDDYGAIGVAFYQIPRPWSITTGCPVQVHTSDEIALTQNYILVSGSALQLQTAEEIALTQGFTLTVQNTQQLQTAENITLTAYEPAIVLVVNNTEHIQTSENVALTQNYALTAQSTQQLQNSDNITLTQNYVLTVQNTQHLQTSDNLYVGDAPTIRGVSYNNTGVIDQTGDVGLTINVPTEVVDGDVMYLSIQLTSSTGTIATPTGWTAIESQFASIGHASSKQALFRRIASSEPASYTVYWGTVANTGRAAGAIIALYKINTANPEMTWSKYTGSVSAGDTVPLSSIDADYKTRLITFVGAYTPTTGAVTWTPPGGMDEITDTSSNNETKSNASHEVSAELVEAGATGTRTATGSLSDLFGIGIILLTHKKVDMVVQDSSHVQTSDNIALIQNYALVIQDTEQLQTSDNIILTQIGGIEVQNAEQIQTSDNVSLTQHHILTVQDATQSQISDNITLAQNYVLSVNNSTHLHDAPPGFPNTPILDDFDRASQSPVGPNWGWWDNTDDSSQIVNGAVKQDGTHGFDEYWKTQFDNNFEIYFDINLVENNNDSRLSFVYGISELFNYDSTMEIDLNGEGYLEVLENIYGGVTQYYVGFIGFNPTGVGIRQQGGTLLFYLKYNGEWNLFSVYNLETSDYNGYAELYLPLRTSTSDIDNFGGGELTPLRLLQNYAITVQDAQQAQTSDNITLISHVGKIIDIDNETGNLTQYQNTSGSNISVTSNAALAGTGYGLNILIGTGNTTPQWAQGRYVDYYSNQIRARFYIDSNSLSMVNNDLVEIFNIVSDAPDYDHLLAVYLHYYNEYYISVVASDDEGAWDKDTGWHYIPDSENYIEVLIQAESSNGSNDGILTLWLNGVSASTVIAVDNYTKWNKHPAYYTVGATLIQGTISGTLYIDELIVRDDSTEIGPNIYTPTQNATQLQTSDNVVLSAHYAITVQNVTQLQLNRMIIVLDTFSRADGALGYEESSNGYEWYAPTWSITTGSALNSPTTTGSNLIIDGDMESVDTSAWSSVLSPVSITKDTGIKHGGSQSLKIVGDNAGDGVKQTTALSEGRFYRYNIWGYGNTSPRATLRTEAVQDDIAMFNNTSWIEEYIYFLANGLTATSGSIQVEQRDPGTGTFYIDDVTLYEMNKDFALIDTGIKDVSVQLKMYPDNTINERPNGDIGIIIAADSLTNPQSFVYFVIRNGSSQSRIHLYKYVNGIITLINNWASNHDTIKIVRQNNSYYCYQGNVLTLGPYTISDSEIVNNTIHGMISLNPASRIDNFIIEDSFGFLYLTQNYSLTVQDATQAQTTNLTYIYKHVGEVANIDHETGDFTQWSGKQDDNNDLSITSDAALAGTGYGLKVVIDDTTEEYVWKDFNDKPYNKIRLRFHFDPNSFTQTDGASVRIANLLQKTAWLDIFTIAASWHTSGGYELWLNAYNDSGAKVINNAYAQITDAQHYIEFYAISSTNSSSSDGSYSWWVDDVEQTGATNVDNYNLFTDYSISLNIGGTGVFSSMAGTLYIDEVVVRDDGEYIGPNIFVPTQNATQIQTSSNVNIGTGGLPVYFMHYKRLRSR